MKTKTLLRPLLMIALMLIMLLSWTVIQSDMVYADEETTYTVFLYSGRKDTSELLTIPSLSSMISNSGQNSPLIRKTAL